MEFSKFKACDCAGMNYHLPWFFTGVWPIVFKCTNWQPLEIAPFMISPMRPGGSETSRCWWLDPRSHEALRRALGEALQDHWGAQPNSRQLCLKWDEIRSFCLGGLFFPEFGGCVHNYSILYHCMICNPLCGYKLGRAWFNIPRLAAIKHFAWLRKSHKLGGKNPIGLEMAMAAIFSSQSWVRIHRHVPPKATRSVTSLSRRRLSVWAPKRWPMGSQLELRK